ncbi:MAG: tam 1 [Gammaproteobacteria bacterium]|jgi:cyclopropane fatty-acyl-phospholipid synthase-like methyltransferase|nr:tam 1 [Gammaproteobacteria bacterium]
MGDTPWVAHKLLTQALKVIQKYSIINASVLEIGCGYGQEAIALAKLGYAVTTIDLAEAAIEKAKANALKENVNIHFQAHDLLHDPSQFNLFDVAFDIAVLHTIENENVRMKFAQKVASYLKPQGIWVNVSCLSPDAHQVAELTGVKAPPALSKEALRQLCCQGFSFEEEQLAFYQILREDKLVEFPAIVSVFRKK